MRQASDTGYVRVVSLLVVGILAAQGALAEVRAAAADGFWSTHSLVIGAPDRLVYRALTKEVSRWWNAEHSYSGEARNFRLSPVAGGCFCERMPGGGSVEHMRVVFVQPNRELRLVGGLGPLQTLGVSGSMVFRLIAEADGKRTRLEYSYRVGGSELTLLDTFAEAVDAVQLDQLMRLKLWVERRNPNWPALNQR